jgi:hypothetical protein
VRNWREYILQHFEKSIASLILAADPDGLLLEEKILSEINKRGFEVISYSDPIGFRYIYETKYRQFWDEGKEPKSALVVRLPHDDLKRLPYDLLRRGYPLTFRLTDIFPKFSYPVIKELDFCFLDKLYEVQPEYEGPPTDSQTCEFILRKVFKVAVDLIETIDDLLVYLLRRHYQGEAYPKVLDDYLFKKWQKNPNFKAIPLKKILSSKQVFLAYLQTEWARYVKCKLEGVTDKTLLPFDHPDVRRLLDNLFMEGFLRPIEVKSEVRDIEKLPSWFKAGILINKHDLQQKKLIRLFESVKEHLQKVDDAYLFWLRLAEKWAKAQNLYLLLEDSLDLAFKKRFWKVGTEINYQFEEWLKNKFGAFTSLPYISRPVMLHHIPHYIATKNEGEKLALVVLDGMGYQQWVQIRNFLEENMTSLAFAEYPVFAWVPTITTISRQALFAGEVPFYFEEDIFTTAREPIHWQKFWENQGYRRHEIGYLKNLKDRMDELYTLLDHPKIKILGLVINTIDKIMHNTTQGMQGMRAEIEVWLKRGYLIELLNLLISKGFCVYLTSDHGNIECEGVGKINEGILAEQRGERVRIYNDQTLLHIGMRKIGKDKCFGWKGIGLPENIFILLASGRNAFVRKGERLVTHGGMSIEETIVPFVKVWKER